MRLTHLKVTVDVFCGEGCGRMYSVYDHCSAAGVHALVAQAQAETATDGWGRFVVLPIHRPGPGAEWNVSIEALCPRCPLPPSGPRVLATEESALNRELADYAIAQTEEVA